MVVVVVVSDRTSGWLDRTGGGGGGETSQGASLSSCPPGREQLRLQPGDLGKSREIRTGRREPADGGASPRCSQPARLLIQLILK